MSRNHAIPDYIDSDVPRWHVTVTYNADAGLNLVEHDIEELSEIEDLIERGPDWNTIGEITIKLQRRTAPEGLTVEQVAKQ